MTQKHTTVFHFTLGPVQDFVAQARRTRDLWAGSFLLSWLAGQAMAEVKRQQGTIIFPVVDDNGQPTDPLVAAIAGQPLASDSTPQIGSLPNRFKARVPEGFDAGRIETAVRGAWCGLADAVWQQFVEPIVDRGQNTHTIWKRQVKGFWEIAWVQGQVPDKASDDNWLDARKNWRSRWPEPEGGDHCAVVGNLQELSGFVRAREKDNQDAFWQALAGRTGNLELRTNERLCAIALIKRLFPRLQPDQLKQTIGWVPGGKSEAIGNWPSTAYMTVIPWLRAFADGGPRAGDRERLQRYEDEVIAVAGQSVHGERSTRIKSLQSLGRLAWLDGNFFLPAALRNGKDTPLQNTGDPISVDDPGRLALAEKLRKLQQQHPPQPYYALLLLDGDNLGRHLRSGDAAAISKQLAAFSQGVDAIVRDHDGVTLYAGGDDAMALLPMDCALDCAVSLRTAYKEVLADPTFTASAAIVFAHYHLPLRDVLATAHRQLNDVAKDGNGRDSIALAWFKASGKAAQWVSTWADAGHGQTTQHLQELVDDVRKDAFGSSFFYKLRARYPMLTDAHPELPATSLQRMLEAEYLKTRERKTSLETAEAAIASLLAACQGFKRDTDGRAQAQPALQTDALRLARLFAGKEESE